MTKGTRVLRAIEATPWAMHPDKFEAMVGVVEQRIIAGKPIAKSEIEAARASRPTNIKAGSVAVLQLFGIVAQRMDMFMEYSGGTSTERFGDDFDLAVNDPNVMAIVINVDSPGGSVAGVAQLADKIYEARGSKPIVAIANSMAASAAYWIASAADEFVAAPLAFVGAIGVFTVHTDFSGAEAQHGIKTTYVSAGKYKTEGNSSEPLGEEARDHMQSIADEAYGMFVRAVARHRGVKAAAVKTGFGEGRTLLASQALDAGMIDGVKTLDQVLADLGAPRRPGQRVGQAETPALELAAFSGVILPQGTIPIGIMSAGPVLPGRIMTTGTITLHVKQGDTPYTCGCVQHADGTWDRCAAHENLDDDEVPPGDQGEPEPEEAPKTEPAPAARSVPMPDPIPSTATDKPGAVADPIAAERTRFAEINALRGTPGVTDQEINAWINSGATYEAVAAEILRRQIAANKDAPTVRAGTDRAHLQPFASFGEQLQAVVIAGGGAQFVPGVDPAVAVGRLHEMQAVATGHSANVGSDGGFLIGTQQEAGLMKRAYDESVLASRCQMTPIGTNNDSLEIMAIKESSRATGQRYGGVRFYRVAEAETVTASKLGLEKWKVELEDLMAITYLTERLMQDAPAMQAEVENAFAREGAFVLDDEIYRGSGVGQCLGVLNAAATVSVTKESGQLADTVQAENIAKMYARMWPRSHGSAIWVYNTALFPQLQSMQIGTGTSAQLVYMPPGGISGSPYATIYGRPAFPIEQASAPGDVGDLAYIDLSEYKLISKGGLVPKVDESMHVRFLYNERAFRFVFRVNGKPVWQTALTPYKGTDTLSPFVVLGAR